MDSGGGRGFGQNVGRYLSGYTASHTVKQLYLQLPLLGPQISHLQNYSHGYLSLPYLKTSTPFVFLDTEFLSYFQNLQLINCWLETSSVILCTWDLKSGKDIKHWDEASSVRT